MSFKKIKITESPSYIDLILTNCSQSLQTFFTYETVFSVFYKMTVSVLKMHVLILKPRLIL